MQNLLPDWPFMISEDSFLDLQLYLYATLKYEIGIDHWLRTRLLYSLLIAADRMEAIGITSLPNKLLPAFSQPVLPSRSESIDAWRQNIKEVCLQGLRKLKNPVFIL